VNNLERFVKSMNDHGFFAEVRDAPQWACGIDKMIIVYRQENRSRIFQVHIYDSKTDLIKGTWNG
jgi:hypothetical protein